MFCKHTWKILDKTTIPSKIEVLQGVTRGSLELRNQAIEDMTRKVVVISYTCDKCGKLRIHEASN